MRNEDSELLGSIRRRDLEKIERLANEGEDISSPIPEANYMTPLHIAIYNQNIEMTELLLRLGANPEESNPFNGGTFISMWANNYIEFEYWDHLEEIFFLYCKYAGWKRPDWAHDIIHLIFFQGWPKATHFFSQDFK